jgi:hypothetical protein
VSMPSGHGAWRTVIAGCSSAVPSGCRHPECLVRAVEVEELWIPVFADPFAPFVVIGMLGIGHRVEKVCVAGPAAHVLRRARPCTFQAARRRRTGAGRKDLFDHDLVLPGITEVVLVDEPIALFRQGTEPWLAFIVDGIAKHRDIVGIGRAVADAADLKLMEMAVRPAHGCLDIAMDPGQGDAAGHLNATPDKGFDTQQGDGELVDRRPWRHADKYVVLLRHMAMGILVERLWTFACARVAWSSAVYDCKLA